MPAKTNTRTNGDPAGADEPPAAVLLLAREPRCQLSDLERLEAEAARLGYRASAHRTLAQARDEILRLSCGGVVPGCAAAQANGTAPVTCFDVDPPLTLEEVERRHILHVLSRQKGDKKSAAAILGVSLKTLYNKLHSYSHWLPDAADARR
jgi:DNA-binding NtrC family response regulator